MKLKINLLAAAALVAFASVSASAAIIAPTSGNGSLVLYAWDTAGAGNQSYSFNTGLTLNDVLALPAGHTFNAGGSSVFTNFFSAADIQSGNVLFTLLAGDSVSSNLRAITTGLGAPVWQPSPVPVQDVVVALSDAAGNLNTGGYVQPNGVEYTMTDLIAGNGNLLQPVLGIKAPDGAPLFGTVGQTLNVYSTVTIPNDVSNPRHPIQFLATVTPLDLTFTLEANGQLDMVNVSAVPEPNAFWLMGSGLAGVALFMRRRIARA